MEGITDYFYSNRATEAADSIARTEAYEKWRGIQNKLVKKLISTFSEEQKRVYMEFEDTGGVCAGIVYNAIYKTGFLDGIALGITAATHREQIKSAQVCEEEASQ
jgi:hypothetical protein